MIKQYSGIRNQAIYVSYGCSLYGVLPFHSLQRPAFKYVVSRTDFLLLDAIPLSCNWLGERNVAQGLGFGIGSRDTWALFMALSLTRSWQLEVERLFLLRAYCQGFAFLRNRAERQGFKQQTKRHCLDYHQTQLSQAQERKSTVNSWTLQKTAQNGQFLICREKDSRGFRHSIDSRTTAVQI